MRPNARTRYPHIFAENAKYKRTEFLSVYFLGVAMIRLMHAISDTNVGGAGIQVLNLLSHLDRECFDLRVLLPRRSLLTPYFLAEGIAVCEVATQPDTSFSLRDVRALLPIFALHRPDILHTHGFFSARVAARLCGVPHILATRHCAEPVGRLTRLPHAYGALYSRFTDKTVATAAYAAADLLRRGHDRSRIVLIRNGCEPKHRVTPEERAVLRRRLGIPDSAVVLGMNARLERVKGQDILLSALARLKAAGINAVGLFVGCGTCETDYRVLASALGVAECAFFVGFVRDVTPYLNLFDLNINCSRGTETSCLAISEAMSLGIPTLATDFGGNPEMVRDGENGFLYPREDAEALATLVLRLIGDEKTRARLALNAKRMASTRFSAENMAKMYTELYNSMLLAEKG